MLTDEQKDLLIKKVEQILREDFPTKPDWNFPMASVKQKLMRIVMPDDFDVIVSVKVKRVHKRNLENADEK